MYRSFGTLHARLLSLLEVEITELEKELLKVDREEAAAKRVEEQSWLRQPTHMEGDYTSQKRLVSQIHKKLIEYGDLNRHPCWLRREFLT